MKEKLGGGCFLLFFIFALLGRCKAVQTPSLNDDVLGLIVFKADIQDPDGKLSSWNEDDESPCNWNGVQCNGRTKRVSEINLDGFSLSGKLGRGLLQLQSLRKLSLSKNNLTGNLSPGFFKLPNLRILDLSDNSLSGEFSPDFFTQCGPLRTISLGGNKFSGQIPDSLGSCVGLSVLNLSFNQFSGVLPSGVWGLHGLRSIDLSSNLLGGEIPKGMDGLYNVKSINLSKNRFTGVIPDDIGGCSMVREIDFSENLLSGSLPVSLVNLSFCGSFSVRGNSFVGEVPDWIGKMVALENLDLSGNNFSGIVPNSVGNLKALKVLNMSRNGLSGSLPDSMVGCVGLQVIDFRQNLLSGDIPQWIFKVGLQEILLSQNKIGGDISAPLSSAEAISHQNLQQLDLSHNVLSGNIPSSVGGFTSLQLLNLSQNSLTGAIPSDIGELKALDVLDLSENQLNGSIPPSLEHCSSLSVLIISHNHLDGPIPSSLSKLTNLQTVDLSYNDLTGTLPKQLANLEHLISFNISHNNLQGELPGGFFNTISPSSVSDNPSLCGSATNRSCAAVLPKPIVLNPNSTVDSYSGSSSSNLPPNIVHKRNILSISSLIAIGAAAVIVIGVISITVLNLRVRAIAARSPATLALSNGDSFSHSPSTDANSGKLVMFSGEPEFSSGSHALLNKDCELGRGGFGAVYKTVLQNGHPVAIKKLTVSSLVKSQDDFEREVKKLGKIRHQNLVALEGYYWTPSLQLLIYEFISGGSLYNHLHQGKEKNFLSWDQRFNIILGMAKGLSHLHQLNVIHYNLKSSNILIDSASGEPKVGDFGLARLLPMLDRYILSSKIQSALGYMAPEFACKTVKITEKCDVYGFGVLVLEVVTGKKPVEYMEDDVVVLCDMVRGALEEGKVEECIDEGLCGNFPMDEVVPVMKLGLICTSQVPSNRPEMREVVNILELIRCPSEGQDDSGVSYVGHS